MKWFAALSTVIVASSCFGCSGRYATAPQVPYEAARLDLKRENFRVLGEVKGEGCATYVGLWPIPLWWVTSESGTTVYGLVGSRAERAATLQALDATPGADAFLLPRVTTTDSSGGIWYLRECVTIKGKAVELKPDLALLQGCDRMHRRTGMDPGPPQPEPEE